MNSVPQPVSKPYVEEGRTDILLVARGIAALSVVLWHAGGYLGPYPAWMNIPGRTAVWLFFGISGYVIAYGFVHGRYTLAAGDLKDFYINRFLRIYPIFLSLTFLGWATEFIRSGASPLTLEDIPSQLFAVQFDQNYTLNGVFWTLGIELHFYLLAPLLVVPLLSDRRIRYLGISALAYAAAIAWSVYAVKQLGKSFDGRNIVACLPHFLAGMIACRLTAHSRPLTRRSVGALASAIALLVVTNLIYHHSPKYFWSPIGIVLTDAAIVCLIFAHAHWPKGSSPAAAVLTTLGTLSYGLYAWHGYWMNTVPDLVNHVVMLTGLSLLSAYVTYRCVEMPALRLRRVHNARY